MRLQKNACRRPNWPLTGMIGATASSVGRAERAPRPTPCGRWPCHPARSAYTLIELLLVVTILGISSVLLIPHLVGRDIMSAEAAVRLIIGDLSFAQSDALAHQEMRRIHFYSDGRGYCLVRIDQGQLAQPFDETASDHDYIQDPLQRPGSLGDYIVDFTSDDRFEGVVISEVDIDGGTRDLQFDQLGGTITYGGGPGTGGLIVLTKDDENYRITISPFTGKLTVQKL